MFSFIRESFKTYFQEGIKINPLLILIFVGFVTQLIKITIDSIKQKKFCISNFFSSGGFPSFHSSIVSSIAIMVLIEFGFDSIYFALACAFAGLVVYDAMNLRFESGKQAEYINEIRLNITSVLTMTQKESLKERLGHTPFEVFAGIILGIALTFVLYYYFI
ncbi:MAG TPA: divergent PAP2 family protein [Candidatus Absconditabacterales bacterium]|nr:divergent PAP2 family protein [Candidatus Absconditabacterales bacterium]HOQ78778.1 divergent PAP2 family protein [Candidatus Absconditabacterales bacterium]HPK27875.1 divergent PAP2 family protein [Candidatus Absconditabacterales bacterium]